MIDLNQESMLGSAIQGWKDVQEGIFVMGKTTRAYESLEESPLRPGQVHSFWDKSWVSHMVGRLLSHERAVQGF